MDVSVDARSVLYSQEHGQLIREQRVVKHLLRVLPRSRQRDSLLMVGQDRSSCDPEASKDLRDPKPKGMQSDLRSKAPMFLAASHVRRIHRLLSQAWKFECPSGRSREPGTRHVCVVAV